MKSLTAVILLHQSRSSSAARPDEQGCIRDLTAGIALQRAQTRQVLQADCTNSELQALQ